MVQEGCAASFNIYVLDNQGIYLQTGCVEQIDTEVELSLRQVQPGHHDFLGQRGPAPRIGGFRRRPQPVDSPAQRFVFFVGTLFGGVLGQAPDDSS